MGKITRLEDLPEWFHLEKYRATEEFGAAEWFACLSVRQVIIRLYTFLDRTSPDTPSAILDFLKQSENSLYEYQMLRDKPLDFGAGKGWIWYGDQIQADKLAKPVRDITFLNILYQFQSDQEAVDAGERDSLLADRWRLIATPEGLPFPHELEDSPVGHLIDAGEAVLVDLRATDSVLIAAFHDWLKEARAKASTNISKREKPAYKNWVRYGLLPYLDLRIWEMETGNHIPHRIMAEAVGYRKGGDSFRSTVPDLADDLMQDLSELEALAAVEISPE